MPQLIHAPELTTLSELNYEWRRISHTPGFGEIVIYFGDLCNHVVKKRFNQMIKEGKIICVTHRTEDGADTFAKMSKYFNAEKAHQQAVVAQDKEERARRSWLIKKLRRL